MPFIWEVTLAEFIGDYPIDDLTPEKEQVYREQVEWFTMGWLPGTLRPLGDGLYLADVSDLPRDVALVQEDKGRFEVKGGYCDSVLWLDPALRGRGYSIEVILLAAWKRNCDMRPISYTRQALYAHMAAHREGIRRAHAEGRWLSPRILYDYPDIDTSQVFHFEARNSADELRSTS